MQRNSLLFLRPVPDEHPIWCLSNQRLAGQVIPTPDAQTRRDAEYSSRTQVLNLRRSKVNERCQQEEIRSLRLEVSANGKILGDCALDGS